MTADSTRTAKTKPKIAVKIEFDGIEQRTIRVPIDADDISELIRSAMRICCICAAGRFTTAASPA